MKKKSLVLKIAALLLACGGFGAISAVSNSAYAMESSYKAPISSEIVGKHILKNFDEFLKFKEDNPNLDYGFDLERFKYLLKNLPGVVKTPDYINKIDGLTEANITTAFCGEVKCLIWLLVDFINSKDRGEHTFEFHTLGVKNFSFKINKSKLKSENLNLNFEGLFNEILFLAYSK